jgi:hypothetical protein
VQLRLTPGTPVCFRCRATNIAGASPFSEPTDELTLAGDVPDEPRALRVVHVGVEHLRLGWSVPQSDGGLAVFEYLVEVQPAGAEPTGWSGTSARERGEWLVAATVYAETGTDAYEAEIGPLRAALRYSVRVSARNTAGRGAWTELDAPCTHGQARQASRRGS